MEQYNNSTNNNDNYNTSINSINNYQESQGSNNEYGRPEIEPSSNIVLGIIGSVIGSLIGVALWIAIYHFGFIASAGGLVIILLSIGGYQKLGGSLDRKGAIISVVIAFIMVFVANYLAWALEVYLELKVYEVSFIDIIRALPEMIKESGMLSDFLKDLLVGYGLTIVGGITTIANTFKKVA